MIINNGILEIKNIIFQSLTNSNKNLKFVRFSKSTNRICKVLKHLNLKIPLETDKFFKSKSFLIKKKESINPG